MRYCMFRKSLLLISLLLSACGTNNTTDVKGKSKGGDSTSTSVSVPPVSTKTPAKELEVTNGSVVYSKKHVIVNAANPWLAPGGVLSGAIFGAAGEDKVLAEIASKHGGVSNKEMKGQILLETSKTFTTGAYDLAKQGTQYIIHALGPDFTIAPYLSNLDMGYSGLRQTYKNVYAEMDQLNKAHQVTTIGVIPISAGVYAGSADKTKLFTIMIEETLSAMQAYPALQPELFLYGKDEYDAVKKLLPSIVSKLTPSSALSSSAVASTARLALFDAPVHIARVGTLNYQGAATSLGSLGVMGGVVDGMNEQLTQLTVGKMNQSSFMGCEFETSYRAKEFAHYAIKVTGVAQVSDSLKLAGGVGYTCENMAVNLSNNVRNFLNLNSCDNERQGVIGDVVAQHQLNLSSRLSFTTTVGIRAGYIGGAVIFPFIHAVCNIDGLGVAAVVSPQEIGLTFQHHQ